MSDSQVSQLIGINPSRNIGGIIARRIERKFGAADGSLDVLKENEVLTDDEQEALSIYRLIGPEYRSAWTESVKSFMNNLPTGLRATNDVGMLQGVQHSAKNPERQKQVSLLNDLLTLAKEHGYAEIVRGLGHFEGQAEQPQSSKPAAKLKSPKRKPVASK